MTMPFGRLHSARSRADSGFTLVELMVTMVIAGLLFMLAMWGWRAYAATQAQRGTAESLVVLMREAQQRAVTEGVAYGIKLSPVAGPWVLLKETNTTCTTGTALNSEVPSRGGVELDAVSFADDCVYFKPRGTATQGSVDVIRDGSSKVYTIEVEGLTGRASVS
jgi:prepilin-type N-terminal cleavage/methylation domain-containing protein